MQLLLLLLIVNFGTLLILNIKIKLITGYNGLLFGSKMTAPILLFWVVFISLNKFLLN